MLPLSLQEIYRSYIILNILCCKTTLIKVRQKRPSPLCTWSLFLSTRNPGQKSKIVDSLKTWEQGLCYKTLESFSFLPSWLQNLNLLIRNFFEKLHRNLQPQQFVLHCKTSTDRLSIRTPPRLQFHHTKKTGCIHTQRNKSSFDSL